MSPGDLTAFDSADLRTIALPGGVISGRVIATTLDEGRDYLEQFGVAVAKQGGLLVLQWEIPRYEARRDELGISYRSDKVSFALWHFRVCSFLDSLDLVEALGFLSAPSPEAREVLKRSLKADFLPNGVRDKKVRSVRELVKSLRTRHEIIIQEIDQDCLRFRKLDPDLGNWRQDVKGVMEFNIREFNREYEKWEPRALRAIFVEHKFVTIGTF